MFQFFAAFNEYTSHNVYKNQKHIVIASCRISMDMLPSNCFHVNLFPYVYGLFAVLGSVCTFKNV